MLSARTTLLGVVGWPVSHSLSPAMQGAALSALGLDWAYAAFAVAPADLATAVAGARALGLRGLNVTIPHKEAALALCEPDAIATRVGAVNTLSFVAGRTLGTNTDVHGFTCLCAESGVPSSPGPGLRAVVLGAGGAARAVVVALQQAGASLALAGRRPGTLAVDGRQVPVLPLDRAAISPLLSGCDLLVDCTPRGLGPLAPAAAFDQAYQELDLALLPRHAVVLDLVVRRDTPLTAAAAALGLRAGTGGAMLLHQGVKALEFWLGRELPPAAIAAMRQALDETA